MTLQLKKARYAPAKGSPETALNRNDASSVKVSKKTYQEAAFGTSTITTLTAESAASFNYDGFKITFACWRTVDQVKVQKVFAHDSVPGFSGTVEIADMGVQIHCTESACSLFPLGKAKLAPGRAYHHFLLKDGTKIQMASVSIEIRPVTPPSAAKFTRDVQFRAAMAAFKAKVDKARSELEDDLSLLLDIYADKVHVSAATKTEKGYH